MYDKSFHQTADLSQYSFLITGGAGFIGSNLVEYLLKFGAGKVRILDNFSTGKRHNIAPFFLHSNFELIEGDIRNIDSCRDAMKGIDYVLHQAALGSVPRSVADPSTTNEVNISGFLNVLIAARDAKVKRVIYAASSSTYGDSAVLPKMEDVIGKPLSPYAVTKLVNELYAGVFAKTFQMELIGLRYFNVFGPRQDPDGEYAAVIPKFISTLMQLQPPLINGDGSVSRDFTFVENIVQINIRAVFTQNPDAVNQVFNAACGYSITLLELLYLIRKNLSLYNPDILDIQPLYGPVRVGDIAHSLACIDKAQELLDYHPQFSVVQGIKESVKWYHEQNYENQRIQA